MTHIMQEVRLDDHDGCFESKIYKSKKKKIIGLSMEGKTTDKNLELAKEFQKKWAPKSFKLIWKSRLMLRVKSNHRN